nr:MAG TPA: hypothetical protein [Caudoviricetes sp.]
MKPHPRQNLIDRNDSSKKRYNTPKLRYNYGKI